MTISFWKTDEAMTMWMKKTNYSLAFNNIFKTLEVFGKSLIVIQYIDSISLRWTNIREKPKSLRFFHNNLIILPFIFLSFHTFLTCSLWKKTLEVQI